MIVWLASYPRSGNTFFRILLHHLYRLPTYSGFKSGDDLYFVGAGDLTLKAHSVAVMETGGNTVVLVNTSNAAETVNSHDFHAANMMIVLSGTHLGLASNDFHLV